MSSKPTTEKKRTRPVQYLGAGIAIGVAIGVAVDNIGAGIAVGIAMGVAMDSYRKKKAGNGTDGDSMENSEQGKEE